MAGLLHLRTQREAEKARLAAELDAAVAQLDAARARLHTLVCAETEARQEALQLEGILVGTGFSQRHRAAQALLAAESALGVELGQRQAQELEVQRLEARRRDLCQALRRATVALEAVKRRMSAQEEQQRQEQQRQLAQQDDEVVMSRWTQSAQTKGDAARATRRSGPDG